MSVLPGARVAYLAQLATGSGSPKVTAANDVGLWYHEPGNPLFIVRESDTVATRKIKTLVAFTPGAGSPGQGRGTLVNSSASGDPVATALALFEGGTQGLITQNIDDGPPSLALSLSGDAATGDDTGATFASYGPPARNRAEATAFLGRLNIGPGVTKADASRLFLGPDMNGKFSAVVRTSGDAALAGAGATFSVLKDPVLSEDGRLAFPATLKGSTVKGALAQTLWYQPPGAALQLLAQGGASTVPVPGVTGAQWLAFTSLAIAADRGPVFTATLVPGKGPIPKTGASGAWACDFNGALRYLFRTGTPIDVNGTMKTLQTFTLLKAATGSPGVTRSLNDTAEVVWLATFKEDKSQAIMTTVVP